MTIGERVTAVRAAAGEVSEGLDTLMARRPHPFVDALRALLG